MLKFRSIYCKPKTVNNILIISVTPDPDIDFFKDMEPTVKVKKVRVCIDNIVTNFLLSNDVVNLKKVVSIELVTCLHSAWLCFRFACFLLD